MKNGRYAAIFHTFAFQADLFIVQPVKNRTNKRAKPTGFPRVYSSQQFDDENDPGLFARAYTRDRRGHGNHDPTPQTNRG